MSLFRKKDPRSSDINQLEVFLQRTLTPIFPRPPFEERLKRELNALVIPKPFIDQIGGRELLLIAAVSLFCGTILLVAGIRTAITLLAALGIIHQARRQVKEKPTTTSIKSAA